MVRRLVEAYCSARSFPGHSSLDIERLPPLRRRHGGLRNDASRRPGLLLLGHEVRLVRPIYVKPFGKRQKNDAADAEAVLLHWLALNALGVSSVPGNPDYTADELTCLLEHGEAALLVVLPSRLAQVEGWRRGGALRGRKRFCARPCQASAKTAGQQARAVLAPELSLSADKYTPGGGPLSGGRSHRWCVMRDIA